MQFANGIWQAAWDAYRINLKTVLIVVGLALVFDLVTDYLGGASSSSRSVADLFIWGMLAISIHGTILLNQADLATTNSKLLVPFVLRSLALVTLMMVPTFAAIIYFYEPDSLWLTLFKALPVIGAAALVVFALFGTWLPATVVGTDKRFGSAFARGTKTFLYTAIRLIIGPGLIQGIITAVVMTTITRGIIVGEIYGAAGFSFLDLVFWPVTYLVRAYSVALLAVILSRAYLIAEQTMAPSAART